MGIRILYRCAGLAGWVAVLAALSPVSALGGTSYQTLYSFLGVATDGAYPAAAFIGDGLGNYFSTAELAGRGGRGTVFEFSPNSQNKVTALYGFKGGATDGGEPDGDLITDSSGNFYGTTLAGGPGACTVAGLPGCGTVFEVMADGTEKVLYAFKGGSDGMNPQGALLADEAGNLYGLAYQGGGSSNCIGGCGIAFELSPMPGGSWSETILYTFQGKRDAAGPYGTFVADGSGNLYTATWAGGGSTNCSGGCGAVVELSPSQSGPWTETVLYTFKGKRDGSQSGGGRLLPDGAGGFYGTTAAGGGSVNCSGGCGTVYRVTPTMSGSWAETVLYRFQGGTKGAFPGSSLISDASGNLYGTSSGGTPSGVNLGCGTVFTISAAGVEKTLHSFGLSGTDGCNPVGGLISDGSGTLYGLTFYGGQSNKGTIFKVAQ